MEAQGLNPSALQEKPTVYDWMQEYINAFDILSSRRSIGFAPNPISMQDIYAYLQIYGTNCIDTFIKHIIVMDVSFLNYVVKKQNTK